MVVRIMVNVLRASAVLALIFGVLSWVGVLPDSLIGIHMLLGIIVVLSLWTLGAAIALKPKGIGLAIGAFVLGLITLGFGLTQKQILPDPPNAAHVVVQIVHLLIGLSAIGMGETISGRYKRQHQVAKMQAR
jgi:hypothetical protein